MTVGSRTLAFCHSNGWGESFAVTATNRDALQGRPLDPPIEEKVGQLLAKTKDQSATQPSRKPFPPAPRPRGRGAGGCFAFSH
jgi:hypothetical protein